MAGHSKWANIKHRKARQDSRRSKIWSKCAKAIMVAAKMGGGDPAANLSLRYAIDEAKSENMPKDTIENAIKKGCGELEGVTYEEIVYEGYGPNGVAVMLDILTDNRNRTAGEIRKMFEKGGGSLGTTGCVSYVFTQKGQIFVLKEGVDEDTLMMTALDAGAEDIADEGEGWIVETEPSNFIAVREAIEATDIAVESARITMVPNNTVDCTGDDARKVYNLIDMFEDHDDVQKVHANHDISDEELAKLEG